MKLCLRLLHISVQALLPAAIVILSGCSGGAGNLSASIPSQTGVLAAAGRAFASTASAARHVPGSYNVVYRFTAGSDGALPHAGLIDVNGVLYGATSQGGSLSQCDGPSKGCGTVFKITFSGDETVIYRFAPGADAAAVPLGGLLNVGGTLYGTTVYGGSNNCVDGCGTVFKITTSGAESTLYQFNGYPGDGSYPEASLINVDGTLYGTTHAGGSSDRGTVFKITTSGKESVLHSFRYEDGWLPYAGLLKVGDTLYGTTSAGGSRHSGTVFKITTSGKKAVLHSFGSDPDGNNAQAGLINVGGALFGTTCGGGTNDEGTVFKITTSGKETVLHSFTGYPADGVCPAAALTDVDGVLYGTTVEGGTDGYGTVFKITSSGQETLLHTFAGFTDGALPYTALLNVGGTLYGSTSEGGGQFSYGTVFSIQQ